MKPHRSLFTKILLWFFLNLVVLATIALVFFNLQFRLGPQSPFGGPAEDRIVTVAHFMARELNGSVREDWDEILKRYSATYGVEFIMLAGDGQVMAGKKLTIPFPVMQRVANGPPGRRPPRHGRDRGGPPERMGPPPDRPPGPPRFSIHTTNPSLYWVGIRVPLAMDRALPPAPATLLAVSESMTGHGLFFDPTPWMVIAALLVIVSAVMWAPMVRSITRPIRRMTQVTERISRGQFNARLDERRADEIGVLGKSINEMASRLDGYVSGQKRFLGDVAHELASPIARIQLGLGVLEQRIDAENQARVRDVAQEVQHMSDLVNELLSFSRAEISPAKVKLGKTPVAPIVHRVLERERTEGAEIRTFVPDELTVVADPELLARALANIVRNAVRYAGSAGPIDINARREQDEVIIEVCDSGAGVSEESLFQLFEPFYRPEASRGRESGGVGLGLAIVKTCIQTCHGAVSARNLQPHGFCVTIVLTAIP